MRFPTLLPPGRPAGCDPSLADRSDYMIEKYPRHVHGAWSRSESVWCAAIAGAREIKGADSGKSLCAGRCCGGCGARRYGLSPQHLFAVRKSGRAGVLSLLAEEAAAVSPGCIGVSSWLGLPGGSNAGRRRKRVEQEVDLRIGRYDKFHFN